MSHLSDFVQAIQHYEGWFPGSRSWRNNNPGNLRGTPDDGGGYRVFDSYVAGVTALQTDVIAKCLGRTQTRLRPSSTILEFFKVWAPKSDGNAPLAYAEEVAKICGLRLDTTLSEIYP